MAFRIKTAACLMLAALLPAQDMQLPVRHAHLRKGGEGVIALNPDGLSFTESGKKRTHSRRWKYEELQWLELSPTRLRIVTYEDVRWQLGRDLEYTFDHIPKDMPPKLYSMLREKLDQRFLATLPDPGITPLWTTPAKMLRGRSGSNGTLKIGAGLIVFESAKESRTWRYADIEGVTTEGPLELTISSLDRETRFQLKQVLPEDRYNDLWLRITQAHGLKPFHSKLENHRD